MRINEDYLDDIEDFQDVLQQDEPLRQYGKWWVVQVKEYSQAAADTGKNDSFIPKFSKQLKRFFQIDNISVHMPDAEPELYDNKFLPKNGKGAISFDCHFRSFNETFRFFRFMCSVMQQYTTDFVVDYMPGSNDGSEFLFLVEYYYARYVVVDYWLEDSDVRDFTRQDASKMLGFLYDTFDLFQRWLPDYNLTELLQKLDDKLYIGDCITFCKINGFTQLTGRRPQMLRWPIDTAILLNDLEVAVKCQFWRLHMNAKVLCGEGLRAVPRQLWKAFELSPVTTRQVSMYWHEQLRTIMLGFMSNVIDGRPFYVFAEYKMQENHTVETFINGLSEVFPKMKIDDMEEIHYELSHLII